MTGSASPASPAESPAQSGQGSSRLRVSTPAKQLLRFLAGVMIFCGVACLYFAQLSEITAIRRGTAELRQEAMRIEHANAALMLDVAAWNRPDYIQSQAGGLGLGPAGQPAFVQLQPEPGRHTVTEPAQPGLSTMWQQLTQELQKTWASVLAVPRGVAQAGR